MGKSQECWIARASEPVSHYKVALYMQKGKPIINSKSDVLDVVGTFDCSSWPLLDRRKPKTSLDSLDSLNSFRQLTFYLKATCQKIFRLPIPKYLHFR